MIYISEDWVNDTEHYSQGESGVYETRFDKIGELFKSCQKEYGRCTSKVYHDIKNKPQAIGWVFEKIAHYEDTQEPYKLHTWITLHDAMPKHHTKYHYHELKP